MIYISPTRLMNDIRANLWQLTNYEYVGIIAIPRSGMIPATILSEELHVGMCSYNEFFDNNGHDSVFYRHGDRTVNHKQSNIYLVVEDSCCHGSMGEKVQALKKAFPDKMFVSLAIYIDGPCNLYKPDICFVDFRRDIAQILANNPNELSTILYYYNILDGWWNFKFLYDLDGVMCVDPPDDRDTKAYEEYLRAPKALHLPITSSGNPIDICTYRLCKYEKETKNFLNRYNVNYGKLIMFPAATKEIRNLTPSAYYKAQHYKDNKYILFIESNDEEAQQICRLSGKPVYCYSTGRMYKYNK